MFILTFSGLWLILVDEVRIVCIQAMLNILSEKPQLIREMLLALEAGQDEILKSIKPKKLTELINEYKSTNGKIGKGECLFDCYSILPSTRVI